MRIRGIAAMVKDILEEIPETRCDDDLVYVNVCLRIDPVCLSLSFPEFLATRHRFGFPGFETVRRARQKVQEKHPELQADFKTMLIRINREAEIREFARS